MVSAMSTSLSYFRMLWLTAPPPLNIHAPAELKMAFDLRDAFYVSR